MPLALAPEASMVGEKKVPPRAGVPGVSAHTQSQKRRGSNTALHQVGWPSIPPSPLGCAQPTHILTSFVDVSSSTTLFFLVLRFLSPCACCSCFSGRKVCHYTCLSLEVSRVRFPLSAVCRSSPQRSRTCARGRCSQVARRKALPLALWTVGVNPAPKPSSLAAHDPASHKLFVVVLFLVCLAVRCRCVEQF